MNLKQCMRCYITANLDIYKDEYCEDGSLHFWVDNVMAHKEKTRAYQELEFKSPVKHQLTDTEKVSKCAFLLGVAWGSLNNAREIFNQNNIKENAAFDEACVVLKNGIENLFYKEKYNEAD